MTNNIINASQLTKNELIDLILEYDNFKFVEFFRDKPSNRKEITSAFLNKKNNLLSILFLDNGSSEPNCTKCGWNGHSDINCSQNREQTSKDRIFKYIFKFRYFYEIYFDPNKPKTLEFQQIHSTLPGEYVKTDGKLIPIHEFAKFSSLCEEEIEFLNFKNNLSNL